MPQVPRDPELVAQILVEAAVYGPDEAAERNGISRRTVGRYMAKLREDPEVAEYVHQKRKALSGDWIERTDAARKVILDSILESLEGACLRDKAGALKMVGESNLAERLVMGDGEFTPAHTGTAEGEGEEAAGTGTTRYLPSGARH